VITAIRHVGIVVRDLNRSLVFYSEILGLAVYRRYVEEGPFIDELTGLKNVKLEWVKLIIPKGGLIELLQYHSHPDPETLAPPKLCPSNALGCSHVALTVSNLDETYSRIRAYGYFAKSAPIVTPNNASKILYCHDPDGTILELIEDITTPATAGSPPAV
jgi:catechol 2,3-dioxygenase-like lactoylglutathione lyase family enzyme